MQSHWELSDSGPPRRTYQLTTVGGRHLRASEEAVGGLLGLLEEFVSRSRVALADAPGVP